jgi:hypothetical protein
MIESAIEIVDRIIQMLQYKGKCEKDILTDHIDPIFVTMEQIHKDYLTSTQELMEQLSGKGDIDEIVSCLRARKTKFETIRVKTDSYVKAASSEKKYPDCAKEFFDSCIYYFNAQSHEVHDHYFGHFSRLIESVVSEKEKLEANNVTDKRLSFVQTDMHFLLQRFQDDVRSGWQRVTDAYGKCRVTLT